MASLDSTLVKPDKSTCKDIEERVKDCFRDIWEITGLTESEMGSIYFPILKIYAKPDLPEGVPFFEAVKLGLTLSRTGMNDIRFVLEGDPPDCPHGTIAEQVMYYMDLNFNKGVDEIDGKNPGLEILARLYRHYYADLKFEDIGRDNVECVRNPELLQAIVVDAYSCLSKTIPHTANYMKIVLNEISRIVGGESVVEDKSVYIDSNTMKIIEQQNKTKLNKIKRKIERTLSKFYPLEEAEEGVILNNPEKSPAWRFFSGLRDSNESFGMLDDDAMYKWHRDSARNYMAANEVLQSALSHQSAVTALDLFLKYQGSKKIKYIIADLFRTPAEERAEKAEAYLSAPFTMGFVESFKYIYRTALRAIRSL